MKLANKALALSLAILFLVCVGSAQTRRSENDPRNTAPTVGTGGPVGGATGLFTVYDGQTLRKGEFTFSAAYSNFDRDPGNVDITEVPVSFQIGLSDHWELFFNTDAYRSIKANNLQNLSGAYLPNGTFRNRAAIVIGPTTLNGGQFANLNIYRPPGTQGFYQFPYTGGLYANTTAAMGPPRDGGGSGADIFPGIGVASGGILPGIVWGTVPLSPNSTAPYLFTTAPSYLPDAPFLSRSYSESAFSTFTVGAKWRWTSPNNPVGVGIIPFYRFYADDANSLRGFNQLQRGASPGGNGLRGDMGAYFFVDSRLTRWMNLSSNIGYIYNSSVKAEYPNGTFTLLDRGDELQTAIGLDFPINKYFQPIGEIRMTKYVGGRTPNALEQDPIDALVGVRFFPYRWASIGLAYRYNVNQQDYESFSDSGTETVTIVQPPTVGGPAGQTITRPVNFENLRGIFPFSDDPHGFIVQFTAGRRNSRGVPPEINKPANVTAVDISDTEINLGCPPGTIAGSGCNENSSVSVRTTAADPENDTLVYNYTVSGGRIVGQGANVNWDLSGVRPGTYTITAGVDDGCGVCGRTETKTITVKECADCQVPKCECPTISVTGPSSTVKPGEEMVFTANVSGGSNCNPTYNWTVSAGTIVSGQGTPVIRVSTAGLAGTSVTATVDVGGCCADCPRQASETGSVDSNPEPIKTDEFGDLKPDDIRGRLDNYFIELQNDPSSTGTVIIEGPKRRRDALERLVRNHISFRKFDASRISIVQGGEGEVKVTLWRVPAGATAPTP